MRPTVSIIICTRNRSQSLKATLFSIGGAIVAKGWVVELVVVDNGSDDDTSTVAHDVRLPNFSIKYVSEPRVGQCHARNKGLAETTGNVVLFTDDDVLVPETWISDMCEPIVLGEADAVQGGVKAAPHLEREWIRGFIRVWLASVEPATKAPQSLVGANMAFARHVTESIPGFDTNLGPGALGFFDDTLFSWQLVSAGYRLRFSHSATVIHHFDSRRLTLKSLLATAAKMGKSRAYVMHHWEHAPICCSFREWGRAAASLLVHSVQQVLISVVYGRPYSRFIFDIYRWTLLRERLRLSDTPRRYLKHGVRPSATTSASAAVGI